MTAQGAANSLQGTFESSGTPFAFSATLQGDSLTLVSGGSTYSLQRQAEAATQLPPAQLTQTNAAAFLEALEFVLAQIGYAYSFTAEEEARL